MLPTWPAIGSRPRPIAVAPMGVTVLLCSYWSARGLRPKARRRRSQKERRLRGMVRSVRSVSRRRPGRARGIPRRSGRESVSGLAADHGADHPRRIGPKEWTAQGPGRWRFKRLVGSASVAGHAALSHQAAVEPIDHGPSSGWDGSEPTRARQGHFEIFLGFLAQAEPGCLRALDIWIAQSPGA